MSYLHDYLEYASNNEAPEMYHVWCAYYCLSAGISRRVWMIIDGKAVYCQLYVLLVGGAGGAKSSALDKALPILNALNLPVSGDKETVEGMLRFMTGVADDKKPIPPYGGEPHKQIMKNPLGREVEVHPMNIVASEFVDFIKVDDMGWINILNNIFDRERYLYKTKNQGIDLIEGPYITLIGGLTTQISAAMQKDNIINTGLARRTLFQFGERQWDNPHSRPRQSEAQRNCFQRCIDHLAKFKKVHGEFHFTEETGLWWDDWYGRNLKSVPTKSPSTQGWFASKGTQMMKLAMLTSLSERLDLVLEVKHFELALQYLARLEKDLFRIFGGLGQNKLAEVALKIYNYILARDSPVSRFEIQLVFWRDVPQQRDAKTEVDECLQYLLDDQKILCQGLGVAKIAARDHIFATPEVMKGYVEQMRAAGAEIVQSLSAPSASPVVDSPVACPSSEPPAAPADSPSLPANQALPQSPTETETDPSPTEN